MNKPALNQFITFPELLQFHYEHNADQKMFIYGDTDTGSLTEITYLEFIRASHRVAHILRPGRSGSDGEVVAVMALLDTITYVAIVAGLIQAGLVPLLVSPRLPPAAVVDLMRKTGVHRLLATHTTQQDSLRNLKVQLLSDASSYDVTFEEAPGLKEVFPKLGNERSDDPFEPYPPFSCYPDREDVVAILHSSGSTGFPKAIPITAEVMHLTWGINSISHKLGKFCYGAMSLPSFHAMGFVLQLLWPVYNGITIAIFPPLVTRPDVLPMTPTPDNIIEHIQRTRCEGATVVPATIQLWSQSASSVNVLRSLKILFTGGGPVAPETGDYLVSCGVKLHSTYGGTEFGTPANFSFRDSNEDWAWLEFPPRPHIRWVSQGDGTFELQCLNTDYFRVSVENLPDVPGYATSDLWVPHPTKPNLWQIVGRVDDVLIHSSGEKTVPGPFEKAVSKSPLIIGVVMFGRQRDQPGVLVEPSTEYQVDVNDEAQVVSFRNKLWPVVEEANKLVPAFSRVYKELILIASPSKPLPRASKDTVMRKAAYKEYEHEIDQIYKTVESTSDSIEPPSNWEIQGVQDWLMTQVEDLCHNFVDLHEDIFEHGFDSLCATILRRRIISALQKNNLVTASHLISQNTIYNYPTIVRLANHIVGLVQNPTENGNGISHESAIEDMIAMYSKGLDTPLSSKSNPALKTVVLLTGSTGNLGGQILASLLLNESVATVYALNRPSSLISIQKRHHERFQDKELDVSLLSSARLVLLEGEISQPKLGLLDDVYKTLQENVTAIIHNAWRLDFNLSLSSFEPHVRGVRNLIDLARSSQYASSLRFVFTSSIASAQSWNSKALGPYPEEIILDPQYAIGTGYGESKYASERILARSGLHATSFRIGQIAGGHPNGAWATSDWLPMIVKSSLVLGVLPDGKGTCSWIPMDAIAEGILDVGLAQEDPPFAINLVHPRPVSWTSIMGAIRESLLLVKHLPPDALQLVPFEKWIAALERRAATDSYSEKVANDMPAVKIIEFIRGMAKGMDGDDVGGLVLATANIQRLSKRIKELDHIGAREAALWVQYWTANFN